ncbi:glutathione S-transferase A2-like [Mustela nigripes]|uniref:glutathione S-transferase A2-like n=1 Tax=Mustela nigripes TaxID=77151 RepID=UPI002814D5FA|nr:glutathione S-transferase A2-like [Mustela nigripes]
MGTTPKAFYSAPYLFSRDRTLMFQQVPMVDISEMKSVQTRAVFNYLVSRYDLCGRDLNERALCGTFSVLSSTINRSNLVPSLNEQVLKSHGQDYLVGNRLSKADIHLVELLYYVEEIDPSLLANFPLLKALKTRVSNLPTVKKFLQPGSQRKPPINEKSLEQAKKIFRMK